LKIICINAHHPVEYSLYQDSVDIAQHLVIQSLR